MATLLALLTARVGAALGVALGAAAAAALAPLLTPAHTRTFTDWRRADYIARPGDAQARCATAADAWESRYRVVAMSGVDQRVTTVKDMGMPPFGAIRAS